MGTPPAPFPPAMLDMFSLNANVGQFIGYGTLVLFGVVALCRLPSFYRHSLRLARASSRGFYLYSAPSRTISSTSSPVVLQPPPQSCHLFKHLVLTRPLQIIVPLSGGLTLAKVAPILVYMIILVILSVYKNTNPATSLTNYRRFGFIAVAQLPLTFILAMKNGPVGFFTGEGYEKIQFLHRFIGRMVFVFAVIHGSLQMRFQTHVMKTFLLRDHALTGFIALCALFVVALTSLRFIRNRLYQFFLVVHIAGYLLVIISLWLHTPSTHPYLAVAIGALAMDAVLKAVKTRVKRATLTAMPGGLTRIEVSGLTDGWRAGQHVFIRVLTGRHVWEKHPFTIANAPGSSSPHTSTDHLLMVVKAAGDFSSSIHRFAGQALSSESLVDVAAKEKAQNNLASVETPTKVTPCRSCLVLVDGPYGSSFNDMTQYSDVLLCAGGSGFTYCMATLEGIVGEAVKGGNRVTRYVCLVWSLREPGMIESFAPALENCIAVGQAHEITIVVKLFITSQGGMDLVQNILPNTLVEFSPARPDLALVMSGVIDHRAADEGGGGGLGVGVCGPTGLVESMRATVAGLDTQQVSKVGGVSLHCEKFGW